MPDKKSREVFYTHCNVLTTSIRATIILWTHENTRPQGISSVCGGQALSMSFDLWFRDQLIFGLHKQSTALSERDDPTP